MIEKERRDYRNMLRLACDEFQNLYRSHRFSDVEAKKLFYRICRVLNKYNKQLDQEAENKYWLRSDMKSILEPLENSELDQALARIDELEAQESKGLEATIDMQLGHELAEKWGLEEKDHKRNVQHIFNRACHAIDELETESNLFKRMNMIDEKDARIVELGAENKRLRLSNQFEADANFEHCKRITELTAELAKHEGQLRLLRRKVAHGCTDAACSECDHITDAGKMVCEHKNTHNVEFSLTDIEVCDDCGLSRSVWEQGCSEWVSVDIEAIRDEVEKTEVNR